MERAPRALLLIALQLNFGVIWPQASHEGLMVGWLLDALVSLGPGVPPEPRTLDEAADRFFLRSVTVVLALALAGAGVLAAFVAGASQLRTLGTFVALVSGISALVGILRLIHLWRAANALRRSNRLHTDSDA